MHTLQILVLYAKKMIVSVSADQMIRFWDYNVSSTRQPVFTLYGAHEKVDSLSAIATTEDNNYLITGDTAGCMKMWDFNDFTFKVDHTSDNIVERWFIQSHKRVINCLQIVKVKGGENGEGQKFIVSSSNDHNILMTRFEDGLHIGQFGQDSMWNIYDLSAFNGRVPYYTRSWLAKVRYLLLVYKLGLCSLSTKEEKVAKRQLVSGLTPKVDQLLSLKMLIL